MIDVIKDFIQKHFIMSLATSDDDFPDACDAFYATKDGVNLYFSSSNSTKHVTNIMKNHRVAGTIYQHNSLEGYQTSKIGIQFQGKANRVTGRNELSEALVMYGSRFGGAKDWILDLDGFLSNEHGIYKVSIIGAKMLNTEEKIKHKDYLSFL